MEQRRALTVAGVCLMTTAIAYGFGLYLLPMVLPEMAADLNLNYSRIGTITGSSQIAVLLSIPLADWLVRRMDALPAIMSIQFTAALLLSSFYWIQGYFDFFAIAFVIRAWPVMVWIPLAAVAAGHIPDKWRGTFFTFASAISCVCVSFDGIFSSWFLTHASWRAMWLTASGISIAAVLFSLAVLKYSGAWTLKKNQKPDRKSKPDKDDSKELVCWLKSPGGIILNFIFFLTGLVFMSFMVYLAPYLREELNTSLGLTTMMWSFMGLAGIPGGLFFGALIRRVGVKFSLVLMFAMGTAATVCLTVFTSPFFLITAAVLFGAAQAVIYGMGPAYISRVLSPTSGSRAFAIGTGIMNVGSLAGNFLGGWSNQVFGTFKWFYLAVGLLFVTGILLSLILPPESFTADKIQDWKNK